MDDALKVASLSPPLSALARRLALTVEPVDALEADFLSTNSESFVADQSPSCFCVYGDGNDTRLA